MTRRQHAILPFVRPCPQPRHDARRIIEISVPPSEFARTITLDCTGPAELVAMIDVQVFRLVGAPVMPCPSASFPSSGE
jgi:hypothetical protein